MAGNLVRPKNVTDAQWQQAVELYNAAKRKGDRYPELTVAQAALETGWFKSSSGRYNYFGQKAKASEKASTLSTREVSQGREYTTSARFKDYNSIDEAVADRVKKWGSKYKDASTIDQAIGSIWQYDPKTGSGKGYATDSNYGYKLKTVLNSMGVSSSQSNNPVAVEEEEQETSTYKPYISYLQENAGTIETAGKYSEPKEVTEAKKEIYQAQQEENFLEALSNLQQQPQQTAPQQEQSYLENPELFQLAQVPQIQYEQFQKGGTWENQMLKVAREKAQKNLLKDKPSIQDLINDTKNRGKAQQLISKDNTNVKVNNRAENFSKVSRNKTDREIAEERRYKIDSSIKARESSYTKDNWRQKLAEETQATGDKFRVNLQPNFFDDYLNPAVMIGSMASNLGQAPLQAQQSDSILPYITSIGTPLAVGAMAGLGTQNTGQFVNNLANPLAGTGDLINNLGNKYLPNTYKLNPKAFKLNEENLYRQIGEQGYQDAVQTKVIRSADNKSYPNPYFAEAKDFDKLGSTGSGATGTRPDFIAEMPMVKEGELLAYPDGKGFWVAGSPQIPLEDVNLYKKDWLQGYKKIETPKAIQNFNSEIDWSKWNKEIPDNPQLMKEYNAIEQTSKANGSWMKNPNGSKFEGTPEQFIQQNSDNFKKAYPNGYGTTYRGQKEASDIISGGTRGYRSSVFTGDLEQAKTYANNWKEPIYKKEITRNSDSGGTSLNELIYPKTDESNIFKVNAKGANWDKIENSEVFNNLPEYEKNFRIEEGNFNITTDDIAKYMEDKGYTRAEIKNVIDNGGGVSKKMLGKDKTSNTVINNNIQGNYLKSMLGNNGMFDMTNPNIYKAVVPGAIGLGAVSQLSSKETSPSYQQGGEIELQDNERAFLEEYFQDGGIIKDNNGYWNPNNWGKTVEISSPNITMKGVKQPLVGYAPETGETKIMLPGEDYFFKGANRVVESQLIK